MPNPIFGLIMIGLGIACFFAFDFAVMSFALTIAGIVWMVIGAIERFVRRPTRDANDLFHDGATGRFISQNTYYSYYLTIGVTLAMGTLTKLDDVAQIFPMFTSAPPEYQVLAAIGANLIGWLIT